MKKKIKSRRIKNFEGMIQSSSGPSGVNSTQVKQDHGVETSRIEEGDGRCQASSRSRTDTIRFHDATELLELLELLTSPSPIQPANGRVAEVQPGRLSKHTYSKHRLGLRRPDSTLGMKELLELPLPAKDTNR